ncbi:hypothetical protein ACFL96_13170 [Thermoproteota archaeon]
MPEITKDEVQKLLRKYKGELQVNLAPEEQKEQVEKVVAVKSREYREFREEYLPKHLSWYEKACNQAEQLFKLKPPPAKEKLYQESINISHLNVTPTGAYTLAVLGPAAFGVLTLMIFMAIGSTFFTVFSLMMAFIFYFPLSNAPQMMANNWRLKASNQMVLCVFYVVTYMRHTSNLELAIDFAADHLGPPLGLDMKRVIWSVETEQYGNIKESLDAYLQSWRKWNMEFIESMHLIEGSLFESNDTARLEMLDKSLNVILDETYEKMLHYAHNLKSPITMLHMLGIILPILTLVILPLVVSFMEGIKWYHLAAVYDFLLPASVLYLGKNILSSRPTGYGDNDASENPEFKKFQKVNVFGTPVDPLYFSIFVGVTCFFIGMLPVILHVLMPGWDLAYIGSVDYGVSPFQVIPEGQYINDQAKYYLLEYKYDSVTGETIIGPFGLGAALISCFLPLSVGLGVGIYYRVRTKNVLKIREETKKLEAEFASALFQLGNRLGDGFPAEIAFSKVADAMQGTKSGEFFELVSSNITRMGMNVDDAIFDTKVGAITKFPSALIDTSMKVLVESAKKGPRIAAEALINVSRYIKQMHAVDERLRDLLADIISSMNSQIKFLSPVISGIVIGITSMVTTILGKLSGQLQKMTADQAASGAAQGLGIGSMFGDGLPTFYFQIIVGFYVVELTIILSIISNGISNGSDKLNEKYMLGQNAVRSTLLYCGIAFVIMLLFNLIASNLIQRPG